MAYSRERYIKELMKQNDSSLEEATKIAIINEKAFIKQTEEKIEKINESLSEGIYGFGAEYKDQKIKKREKFKLLLANLKEEHLKGDLGC